MVIGIFGYVVNFRSGVVCVFLLLRLASSVVVDFLISAFFGSFFSGLRGFWIV